MVGGIGIDLRLKLGHRPGIGGLPGKGELGPRGLDLGRVGNRLGDRVQKALGLIGIAKRQMGGDQPAKGAGVLRLLAQNGGVGFGGIDRGPFGQHRIGGVQRLAQPAVTGQRADTVDEGLDLGPRQRALEPVHRLALPEGIDRRDRLDAQLRGDGLVFVHVDLGHADLALGGGHGGLKRGAKRLARAAPGRPEIHDDRDLIAGLDDLRHEVRLTDVADQIARRGLYRVLTEFEHARPLCSLLPPICAQRAQSPRGQGRGGSADQSKKGETCATMTAFSASALSIRARSSSSTSWPWAMRSSSVP